MAVGTGKPGGVSTDKAGREGILRDLSEDFRGSPDFLRIRRLVTSAGSMMEPELEAASMVSETAAVVVAAMMVSDCVLRRTSIV